MTTLNTIIEEENTPDTEWVREYFRLAKQWRKRKMSHSFVEQATIIFIRELLTSRNTYWKERVRKEVEVLQERFGDWDNGDENEPLLLKCEVLEILDNLK